MSISEIQCADDLAALASEALQQVRIHKQYRDLIGAIFMANHIADWHYIKDIQKPFKEPAKKAMRNRYPEWDILRELANGTKHCKPKDKQDAIEWEHDDFYNSPGHVGEDGLNWFVDFDKIETTTDKNPYSVTSLIEKFLTEFADRSSRPK